MLLKKREKMGSTVKPAVEAHHCQAAGEAACLAIKTGKAAGDVDIRALQAKLEKENVMVRFPDSYIPEDRTVIIHGKSAVEVDGGHM